MARTLLPIELVGLKLGNRANDLPSVKDFGAVGDGIVDDTDALQAALNSDLIVWVPPDRYRITRTLRVTTTASRGSGLYGIGYPSTHPDTSQTGGPTWNGTQEPWIFYDGPDNADMKGTSTTSVTIGTGSKSFTTGTGKAWVAGDPIRVSSDAVSAAAPYLEDGATNYMTGTVTSYDDTTGALVVNVTAVAGSGTKTDWTIKSWTACLAVSYSEVAVEHPGVNLFNETIGAFQLQNIGFDGNLKADFGLYCVRVQEPLFMYLHSRQCVEAGYAVYGTYSGSMFNCTASLQQNVGFDFGFADRRWGWTTDFSNNALRTYTLHASGCGGDSTFRQADNRLRRRGCGFFLGGYRNNACFGITTENCFGAGVIMASQGYGNVCYNIYTESSCSYAPGGAGTDAITLGYATDKIGLMFIGGTIAGASFGCRFVDGSFQGDKIYLTGTEPGNTRPENGVEFYNITGGAGVIADWGNYRLINCSSEFSSSITGTQPVGAWTVNGGIKFVNGSIMKSYKEGTFTPALKGLTVAGTGWATSIAAASYTRSGRLVTITGRITLSTKSADATGQIAVDLSGAGFTAASGSTYDAVGQVKINAATTAIVSATGVVGNNTNYLALSIRTAAAVSETSLALANLADTTTIQFSVTFVAA